MKAQDLFSCLVEYYIKAPCQNPSGFGPMSPYDIIYDISFYYVAKKTNLLSRIGKGLGST